MGRLAIGAHELLARRYPDIAERSKTAAQDLRDIRHQKLAYDAQVAAVAKVEEDIGQLRPPWSLDNASGLPQPKDVQAWWSSRPEHRSFPDLEAWHSIGYKPVPLHPLSHQYYLILQANAGVHPARDGDPAQPAPPPVAHSVQGPSMPSEQEELEDERKLNVHDWTMKDSSTGWPEPKPNHDFKFERGDWMPDIELWHKYGYEETAHVDDPLHHCKHK
jgi:hypothetical protein